MRHSELSESSEPSEPSALIEPAQALAIDASVVQQAVLWMARLWSDSVSEADRAGCARWRAQQPAHEQAWQRLQLMEEKFAAVPDPAARAALRSLPRKPATGRRKALRVLGLGIAVGGAWRLASQSEPWQQATADYRSARGEIRRIELADGSVVMLNTGSAIDVVFSGGERRIVLKAGEIMVITAPDKAAVHRPFVVYSGQGAVRALGTEFVVRQLDGRTSVAVLHGAVEIRPQRGAGAVTRLDAGGRTDFSSTQVEPPQPAGDNSGAWSRGVLVAEQMRLDDLLAELGRYRAGILRCDPAVAALKVSGVYSLRDTERALHSLTVGLPLQLSYRTRYWVSVAPRRGA
ncbi:FecR domain-containing protein [Rugamonas sp. CCM 8940]|uniref:FecR domain-containing protein n=1 Tax=Rugamonas sp. CCM 8940 TaxID=2765359 RepID=UPI0018F4490D|nr:FecR domain-containing protein [Rugamonas sp. CCM 8940]MBJ7310362.1 FecR domain-containing protein [Rugamonas sp. CCM 8940]